MHFEFVHDLALLAPDWWQLWRQDSNATPFQSPAWLMPWARQFGGAISGAVIGRSDGELTALLPVFRLDGRWLLWGAGTSDWLDGVFAPEVSPSDLRAGLSLLDGPLDLYQMRRASPLAALAQELRPSEPCLAIDLPAKLPHSIEKNLAYYRRRAARAEVTGPHELRAGDIDTLIELHARRWNSVAQPGVFGDTRVAAWHREAAAQLEGAGLLRLYGMRHRNELAAILYALSAKGVTYFYLSGFDPELAALGLGTILIGHAVECAEREGCTRFDFLRGREAYKFHWGAVERPTYAAVLGVPEAVRASA